MLGVRPSFATGFAQWPGMSEYPQLWENLVGSWPFFLGATGGQVFDLSGNGNTGTFAGTAPSWTSGKFGSAVLLPGTDERIDFSNIWNPSGKAQSLSFWIYPKTMSGSHYIFLTHATGDANFAGGGLFWIFYSDPDFYLSFHGHTDDTNVSRQGINILILNKWQHIVFTWDGSLTAANIHIYKNGAEISYEVTADGVGNFTDGGGSHSIGGRIYDDTRNLDAIFDNVYWWNRILSASEIALLYQMMKRLVT